MSKGSEGGGCLLVIFLVVLAAYVTLRDREPNSKQKYASQYNTFTNNVTIDKMPQNCDFFYAPIGKKGCTYRANTIATIRDKDVQSSLSRNFSSVQRFATAVRASASP
jgi:hypothetical protein